MRSPSRFLACAALVLLASCAHSCGDRAALRIAGLTNADALWGGGGFCARTPQGLACWSSSDATPATSAPAVVSGLTGVKDVALTIREGCALHDKGVSCFQPGSSSAEARAFDAPSQLVAIDGHPGLLCVLHAQGVSCWGGETRSPALRKEIGKPKRLIVGPAPSVMCGVYDDGLRCFEAKTDGSLGAGLLVEGAKDPKGALMSSTGGQVYVLDGSTVAFGQYQGTLSVGNPFAAKGPLDVDVTLRPFTGATTKLEPFEHLGAVKEMQVLSIWPIVLDDHGIARLDQHAGTFDVERWPTEVVPSHVWGGHSSFFTREGEALHEHGYKSGDRFDHRITGLTAPKHVAEDTYWACALEESGGVGCVKKPPI